jgi:cytochrome c5
MKHLEGIVLGLSLVAATLIVGGAVAIGQTDSASPESQSKASEKKAHVANSDRGQQVFEQNCARCHNAPQGFSPSVSGTIAMHMRVRAGLSEADIKALRRFLNP